MTTKGSSGCQCGACYVRGDCGDCLECYPHFICANVRSRPGSDVCCTDKSILMYHQCKGAWSGVGVCAGTTFTFSADVAEDEYGNCIYTIHYGDEVIYSAVLEDRSIPSVEVELSYDFEATIGPGVGYRNPEAFDSCGTCKCARCLPQSFCVSLAITPLTEYAICSECNTAGTVSCVGGVYSGTLTCGSRDFEITISPGNQCSLDIDITSGDDASTTNLPLEGKVDGIDGATRHECRHRTDTPLTRGFTGAAAGLEDAYTVTTEPFDITMDLEDGSRAVFTFEPKWCGSCPQPSNPDCIGGCPNISTSCDTYCGSTILHGEIIAPGCGIDGTAFTLRSCHVVYGADRNTNWPAETRPNCQIHMVYETDPYLAVKTNRTYYTCGTTVANATFFTAELYYLSKTGCPDDAPVDITRYVLNIALYAACSGPPPTPYAAGFLLSPASGTCEPFSLDFDFTPVTSVGPCVCCTGSGGTNLIRITE